MNKLKLIAILVAAAAATQVAASDTLDRGARAYAVCAGCHGFAGQGNKQAAAPALAGQAAWYMARQIRNYRSGVRGNHKEDATGQTMATMSRSLGSEEDIDAVAAYIATLPVRATDGAGSISGDKERGKTLFQACAACHGSAAEGVVAMGGPRLASQSDWDLLAQLKKFANGQRGKHPQDTYGQQMAAATAMLGDAAAMQDVVAYIGTLGKQD